MFDEFFVQGNDDFDEAASRIADAHVAHIPKHAPARNVIYLTSFPVDICYECCPLRAYFAYVGEFTRNVC